MAQTPSTMKLNIDSDAFDFELWAPALKKKVSLDNHFKFQNPNKPNKPNKPKGYLIVFMCNHCPYVIHIAQKLSELTREYIANEIVVMGINANDVENYPEDSPEKMIAEVEKRDYPFPYLYDEDQEVAKKYKAACTPDFFLFNENKKLVYRGQFDDSRPGNGLEVTGKDLNQAVENLLNGLEPLKKQIPSLGCNIKWKKGNEPNY